MDDYSLTTELRYALDAYVDARADWKAAAESLQREFKAGGGAGGKLDPSDESHLWLSARALVDTSYLRDASESGAFEELAQTTRRYLREFDGLSVALKTLNQHLERASGEDPPETP